MRLSLAAPFALLLVLAACDAGPADDQAASRPTPAPAPPPMVEPVAAPVPGERETLEPPFVGRWAADAAWCANATGAERPIRITASTFEGYENRCDIRSVVRNPEGWDAALACHAEGAQTSERIRMTVRGDEMVVRYRDREDATATFVRCPPAAAAETPPAG